MRTRKPTLAYFGPLRHSFRVHVHQLLAWGHQDVRAMLRASDDEPAISGYIAGAIHGRLCDPHCPRWCNHYFVADDPPVGSEGRAGRSRRRADIVIQASFPGSGRPEYVFEAKRLHRQGHGPGRYIGCDGMGRFVRGLYASRYDEAGMLGYVQSDTPEVWRTQVRDAIDAAKLELRLTAPQRDAVIVEPFPLEWVSEHERLEVGRPMAIYHVLLDCCG